MTKTPADHARRARLRDAGGQRAARGRRARLPEGGARGGGARDATRCPPRPESVQKGGELFVIYCTPCHGHAGQGRRAGERPSSCRPPTSPIPTSRRGGRTATGRATSSVGGRGDAVLRGGALGRGALARRELPPHPGPAMSPCETAPSRRARPVARRPGRRARGGRLPVRDHAGRAAPRVGHLPRQPALLVEPRHHRARHRRHDAADRGALVARR